MNAPQFETVALARLPESDRAAFYAMHGLEPRQCERARADWERNHYVRAVAVAPVDRYSVTSYRLA